MKIIRRNDGAEVECFIKILDRNQVPRKMHGWSFNWLKAYRDRPRTLFGIFEVESSIVHGVIQLIEEEGMLIMELIELAPTNIGSQKMFDTVAGCLLAFACRQALKLDNNYRGYLTFVSKTSLIEHYVDKYFATQTIGARMYIDPISGDKQITKYLK